MAVPAAALVDRVLADDFGAQALLASRDRVIEEALRSREARGEGRALLTVLAARGSRSMRPPVRASRAAMTSTCSTAGSNAR